MSLELKLSVFFLAYAPCRLGLVDVKWRGFVSEWASRMGGGLMVAILGDYILWKVKG